jgi:hypothetical protein
LAAALDGAAVVVDVTNAPSFEDAAVLTFFQTSTRNLLDAEATAGVGHPSCCPLWGRSLRAPSSKLAERGTYADGVTKGAVDAYIRAARVFGLVTDAEIIQLISARFLEGPD